MGLNIAPEKGQGQRPPRIDLTGLVRIRIVRLIRISSNGARGPISPLPSEAAL